MTAAKKINLSEEILKESQLNKRILVVEDEPGIANSYNEILSPRSCNKVIEFKSSRKSSDVETVTPEEFEVVVTKNAEQALAEVKKSIKEKRPFAMGFFDVLLGEGVDGIALVKEIYDLDKEIFCVFVTAYNDRSVDSIRTYLGEKVQGQWDYLNKPFTSGEILQKARNFTTMWNVRRQAEIKDLKLAEVQGKLLEAERHNAVAAITRGITHEFGNLLMLIMGKADLARQKNEEEMKAALNIILDASGRASEILAKLKTASGHTEEKKNMVNLNDLILKVLDLMEFQFRENNIKISKIRFEKVATLINETAIIQVLVNIMINAIHAMGDSGQIDYSLIKTNNFAEINIRDYGPGVKDSVLRKLKEPLFTTKGDLGSGLGLSISNEIIEIEHQGEFILKNHGVKGFEVLIRIPLKKEGESNAEGS